jgi:hypothetical protein
VYDCESILKVIAAGKRALAIQEVSTESSD